MKIRSEVFIKEAHCPCMVFGPILGTCSIFSRGQTPYNSVHLAFFRYRVQDFFYSVCRKKRSCLCAQTSFIVKNSRILSRRRSLKQFLSTLRRNPRNCWHLLVRHTSEHRKEALPSGEQYYIHKVKYIDEKN